MSWFRSAVLYTALALGANAAMADTAALEALRDGDMKKLVLHEAAKPLPDIGLVDAEGGARSLSEYRGKVVVLNFWATWCAPCRQEMPSLDRLEAELGGDDFAVVTVATGRNSVTAIRKFFDETGITRLPVLRDPNQALAREMAILGLPITVILDREGNEIARLRGDAQWDSDSAKAILRALVSG
ncbi:TlpA disulfide reductase family protein [Actibacterium sp. MT2.3-13A]|uniref:TlpA disulfide reductase family protein n=1 Tax=Actibacterium sp. MT2.3-13A TaxID=2828332 RepID=UPI001BA794B3|nr:TlpA disulfide reductase family protein [Actibacterium sp. MT2.3-13A]